MPEVKEDVKPIDTKPTLINRVVTWTKTQAITAGVVFLGVTSLEKAMDVEYPESVKIQTASDSAYVENGKDIVSRPRMAFDTAIVADSLIGKTVRFIVLLDDKTVLYEQKQDIVNAPTGLNDGFHMTFNGYIYEDRIKPDTTQVKPEVR